MIKRGKGKQLGDVKKKDFYTHYKAHAKEELISKPLYNSFVKELLNAFSSAIVELGLELKINKVGKLRIRSKKLHFFDKNGKRCKSLRVNWEATWNARFYVLVFTTAWCFVQCLPEAIFVFVCWNSFATMPLADRNSSWLLVKDARLLHQELSAEHDEIMAN